jgi:apolipoprotein N-acyltransferase
MLVTGATTIKQYDSQTKPTSTARAGWGGYYDVYNSAVAVNADGEQNLHHKMRLVIGVEAMPFTGFLDKFVALGGITGQLGRNDKATVFEKNGVKYGPAICYEGIYGDCFARFVREGAEVMLVMSNDGWWGNTPGHRRLFDFCRLRAIETRRAVARSANTGVSGFITARGDVTERLDWEQRGVLTSDVEVRSGETLYVKYGDWLGRLATLVSLLTMLYYSAYRVRRRSYLVD